MTSPSAVVGVRLNGEAREVRGATVDEMLQYLEIDPRTVVVELNRSIVRRPEQGSTHIKEGDEIELVHFVGGG